MKTILSFLLCLGTVLPLSATTISDTIVDASEVHRLIVTQDSIWRVNIEGMADDSSFRQTLTLIPDSYEQIKASELLVNSMNFDFPLSIKYYRGSFGLYTVLNKKDGRETVISVIYKKGVIVLFLLNCIFSKVFKT